MITAIKVSDAETIETIKKVYKEQQYLLDFHTAVGYAAAEKVQTTNMQQVILSTASPLKFAGELEKATGIIIDDKGEIEKLQQTEKREIVIENNYESIKRLLKQLITV
jgi:threonine synthase